MHLALLKEPNTELLLAALSSPEVYVFLSNPWLLRCVMIVFAN